MVSRFREFEKEKTEQKIYAIALWKDGISIAQIAKEVGKSRDTIYRWVKKSDRDLSQNARRKRVLVDSVTKGKIIELYVILKRPSIQKLSESLRTYFAISLTPSQLRRYIKRWGMDEYRPSRLFNSLVLQQAAVLSPSKRAGDKSRVEGSAHRSPEHSLYS